MAEVNNEVAVQKAENQTVSQAKVPVKYDTDFSKGIFGSSDNFMMATQMAKAFASSTIVPKEYQGNYANGLVAIDMANRLGISPLTVMQNLDVIQGRPAWRATFLIGMINGSGKYDFELQYEEKRDKDGKPFSCQCWTEKNGRRVDGIVVDMQMAKDEGWVSKNGSKWRTMPQVMLRYRAASFFARMNCPELTNGIYTREEVLEGEFNEILIETRVQQEIQQNANAEEFQPVEPPQIEQRPEQVKMADLTVGKKQKEPTPVGKPDWA